MAEKLEHFRESFSLSEKLWNQQHFLTEQEAKEKYPEAQKLVDKMSHLRESNNKNQLKEEDLKKLTEGLLDQDTYNKLFQRLAGSPKQVRLWKVPISRYGNLCGNKRIYTKELWENVINNQKDIWCGIPGLCDHPKEDDDPGELKYACIVWLGLEIDDVNKLIWGIGIFVGDLGRLLQEIIEVGGRIGFSTSGFGKKIPGTDIVNPETYEIERVADVVINPSQKVYGNLNDENLTEKATKANTVEYTKQEVQDQIYHEGNKEMTNKLTEADTTPVNNSGVQAIAQGSGDQDSKAQVTPEEKQQVKSAIINAVTQGSESATTNSTKPAQTTQPTQPVAETQPAPTTTQPAQPEQPAATTSAQPTQPAQTQPTQPEAAQKQVNESINKYLASKLANGGEKMLESNKDNSVASTTTKVASSDLNSTMRRKFVESYLDKEISTISNPMERAEKLLQLKEQLINDKDEELLGKVEEAYKKADSEIQETLKESSTLKEDMGVKDLKDLKESANKLADKAIYLNQQNIDYEKLSEALTERNKFLKRENTALKLRLRMKENASKHSLASTCSKLSEAEEKKAKFVQLSSIRRNKLQEAQERISKLTTELSKYKSKYFEANHSVDELSKVSNDYSSKLSYVSKQLRESKEQNESLKLQVGRLQENLKKAKDIAFETQDEFDKFKENIEYESNPANHLQPSKAKLISDCMNFKEDKGDAVQRYWENISNIYGDAALPLKESILGCKTYREASRVFMSNRDLVNPNFEMAHESLKGENIQNSKLKEAYLRDVAGYETEKASLDEVNSHFLDIMKKNGLGGL